MLAQKQQSSSTCATKVTNNAKKKLLQNDIIWLQRATESLLVVSQITRYIQHYLQLDKV